MPKQSPMSEKDMRRILCSYRDTDVMNAVNALIDGRVNEACVDAADSELRRDTGLMAGVSGRLEALLMLRVDLEELTKPLTEVEGDE